MQFNVNSYLDKAKTDQERRERERFVRLYLSAIMDPGASEAIENFNDRVEVIENEVLETLSRRFAVLEQRLNEHNMLIERLNGSVFVDPLPLNDLGQPKIPVEPTPVREIGME